MASVLVATAVASVLIIARLILVLPKRVLCKSFKGKSSKHSGANRKAYRTMVVLGSGGHTSEMLSLLRNLNIKKYSPMIFVASNTDKFSEKRLHSWQRKYRSDENPYKVRYISRSREVNQPFFTTIFTTLKSLFECMSLIYETMPDVILCDGPGTCLPPCYICFLFNFFGLRNTKIIFVESFARVNSLSLTGKLVLFVANRFIVQWKETLDVKFLGKRLGDYWNCEYAGIVI